eukprot:CAMPEP_0194773002 /NCGR_PEP_ID=MMETSP0323_2-20130528/53589_1 /TAXON_ID=2866 ORGANISM="Crypthecodinium cohnii, Strain Seligo" /NCGR_SAMPLE_ID=MMETSP0323_2 /ASSEMBLY_ACC=CAM_ASM_000346 /LENGTH=84 /DNA_ID=CAMNT_0039707801 /DNA_START=57 /DNA_END=308 /DNA_ORIENTATION=+
MEEDEMRFERGVAEQVGIAIATVGDMIRGGKDNDDDGGGGGDRRGDWLATCFGIAWQWKPLQGAQYKSEFAVTWCGSDLGQFEE